MAEEISLPIVYTKRADRDAIEIKNYLLYKFTQREVNNFFKLLRKFEEIILVFPELYPVSSNSRNTHRAVLSKQLSVFYRIEKNQITVVAVLDNRMDIAKWP